MLLGNNNLFTQGLPFLHSQHVNHDNNHLHNYINEPYFSENNNNNFKHRSLEIKSRNVNQQQRLDEGS